MHVRLYNSFAVAGALGLQTFDDDDDRQQLYYCRRNVDTDTVTINSLHNSLPTDRQLRRITIVTKPTQKPQDQQSTD